jgi:hypothetical protein
VKVVRLIKVTGGVAGQKTIKDARRRMKLNLGCGNKPLASFANLDKLTGWNWESGLLYPDASIEAITVSHSLMYVPTSFYVYIMMELYRVILPGGVLRITEDATDDPRSERFNGHPEAVSLTRESSLKNLMRFIGFTNVNSCKADSTYWKDASLLQDFHGGRPKVFFIEGKKGA